MLKMQDNMSSLVESPAIPAIDAAAPATFETATFALG